MIVNVELLEYPEKGSGPVGRVVEILGRPGDFGVDVEIVIRKHHLPHRFPARSAGAGRAQCPTVIAERELEGRRDFRDLPIVTIDGETARDFDDAVWVDRLPNGNYALQVHIADVSHYVRPGTPIDLEARLRGTSVYFPDRAVPMLPYELSTDICSLVPQVDRLVLSALLEIDHQGARGVAGIHPRRDSQRRAHDVHQRPSAARRRCRPARALCARWWSASRLMRSWR